MSDQAKWNHTFYVQHEQLDTIPRAQWSNIVWRGSSIARCMRDIPYERLEYLEEWLIRNPLGYSYTLRSAWLNVVRNEIRLRAAHKEEE